MSAAGAPCYADQLGARLELLGMRLHPTGGVVDVHQGGRIASCALPKVQGSNGDASTGQPLMMNLAAGAVVLGPDTAMQLDHCRKRPFATRPVKPRQKRLVAVTEIFH